MKQNVVDSATQKKKRGNHLNQFGQAEVDVYDMLKATVMIHGLPNQQELEAVEGGIVMVQHHVRALMDAIFGGVLAVTIRPRATTKSWALISFATHEAADALMKVTHKGLLLTWPPMASDGTVLQFAAVDEVRAMSSSGAFGQTWAKHKSAVRIARVAAASFKEGCSVWNKQHDGASIIQHAELAHLQQRREEYLSGLDDLAKMEVTIRQAVLDHHEARIKATKIGPEKVFYFLHLLKQVPFFAECSLSEADMKELVLTLDITQYEDGAVIIQEGTVPKDCYLLESGSAEVVKEGMNLNVQYEHGAFFGEIGLKTNENRTASVIAKGECRCIRINKVAFRKTLSAGQGGHKDLHTRQMQYLSHNISAENKAQKEALLPRQKGALQFEEDMAGDHLHVEHDDEQFHVTRASVTAIRIGIIAHAHGEKLLSESEVNDTVHQGIWGPDNEHHSLKKRWSRKLQNHKVVAESGDHVYEGEVEVPVPEFMDNLRKCMAETIGTSARDMKIELDGDIVLPSGWTKMTAIQKVHGMSVGLPDDIEHSETVWIGGLPEGTAHHSDHLKKELEWFGAIQSLTVRVKPGYRKSWALATFIDHESVQLMLGRSGVKFLIMHADKGWNELVFKKSAGKKELAKGKKGALASILARQELKNADASARSGWAKYAASTEQKEQERQNEEALAKERGKISKEPADYLVRKNDWAPKPPGEQMSIDPHQHYAKKKNDGGEKDGPDSENANGTLATAVRLDEFQEELECMYVPGGGYMYHLKSDTQGCKSHGGGPPVTVVDPPPSGGHPRSSVVFAPSTSTSVLGGNAIVEAPGRLRVHVEEEETPALEIEPRGRLHSGPSEAKPVLHTSGTGWMPCFQYLKAVEDIPISLFDNEKPVEVGPYSAPRGTVITTVSHRGIASGTCMFEVAKAKEDGHRWQETVAKRTASVDIHYVTGTESSVVQHGNRLRPSSARAVASGPATSATSTAARPQSAAPAAASPRAQKQQVVADGSAAGNPLTSPAWKPMNHSRMNAGWRHRHVQRPKTAPAQSPKGVSPPPSPPRAGGKRYQRSGSARPALAGQRPMQFASGWDNPVKRF